MTRRGFLRALCAAGGTGGVALGYARFAELHWVEFVHRELPVADLPAGLDGAVLVHLSDLHVGPQVDDGFLRDTFGRIATLAPEYVVMTGDWISYRGPEQLTQLDRVMADFPRGGRATLGVLGNHDYGMHWRQTAVADRVAGILRGRGVNLLRNETAMVDGLQFIGLDDFWSPNYRPGDVLAAHGARRATVVLSHNPDVADEPVWATFAGWILSGHTHGGQCKPPFLPPPLLPVRNRRYTSGAFDVGGGRQMYVNRALGHLLSVRVNVRPEVTVFRLRPAVV